MPARSIGTRPAHAHAQPAQQAPAQVLTLFQKMSEGFPGGLAGALRVGAAHRVQVEVAVEVAVAALQQRAALGQGCNLSRQGPGSNTLNSLHVSQSVRPAHVSSATVQQSWHLRPPARHPAQTPRPTTPSRSMTGNAVCQGGKGAAQARRGGQNSELIIHVPRRAASAPGTSASEVTVATAAMATSEEKRVMAGGR